MPRGKARQYASDVDEWGAGALWGVRLRGGKRGDVLPVHLECWVPRFPFWHKFNKCCLNRTPESDFKAL